jgi:hypothetical protein
MIIASSPTATVESPEDTEAGAAAIAELSAIVRLTSEEDRARLLNGIAARPELSPEQPERLVEVAFTGLSLAEPKRRSHPAWRTCRGKNGRPGCSKPSTSAGDCSQRIACP